LAGLDYGNIDNARYEVTPYVAGYQVLCLAAVRIVPLDEKEAEEQKVTFILQKNRSTGEAELLTRSRPSEDFRVYNIPTDYEMTRSEVIATTHRREGVVN
jgi:hypothetical protein